jgi:hypothetical protein
MYIFTKARLLLTLNDVDAVSAPNRLVKRKNFVDVSLTAHCVGVPTIERICSWHQPGSFYVPNFRIQHR